MFLPFFLFAFYSAGTMPSITEEGIEIIICSGDEIKTIVVSEDGEPIEKSVQTHCEWSSHVYSDAVTAPETYELITLSFNKAHGLFSDDVTLSLAEHNLFLARAPPLSI
ncbi:hypothetical protein RYZ26_17740 [Terasakiella sp. A23]|uniref:hypothetical protein n=1 Tax=Terasakiella sp. FCG-A23 TaxID=3080561 RepID=UPI00295437FB|nr:hypothetical protein [Terasakiella sp. A23]MDV7341456.1 hypothetical protein [Terasakiella sp. A23]